MSTAPDDLYASARTGRWAGVAGIVAAVLMVPGFLLIGNTPEYDAPDAEWVEWFDKDSNTTAAVIGAFLLVLASLALMIFAAGLAARLRAAGGERGNAVMIAGSAVATGVAFMIGGLAASSIAGAITFVDVPVPGPEDVYVVQAIEQIGFAVMLIAGGWSAALLLAISSFSARRTAQLPNWLTIAGMVVAVILLASFLFLPLVLFVIWLLVAGIVLLQPGPAAPAAMR